jgi:hypothetical protein
VDDHRKVTTIKAGIRLQKIHISEAKEVFLARKEV